MLKKLLPLVWICILSLTVTATPSDSVSPWTGEPAIQKRTDEIMARAQQKIDEEKDKNNPKFEFDFPFEVPDVDVDLDILPTVSSPYIPTNASSPQTYGISFTGATLTDTRAYPPDTMGAVGPTQFIVAVNGRIRSFDKNTGVADGVINADTDVFFNSVMTPPATNNFTSDPRIRYDRLSKRWFIIIIDVPGMAGSLPNRVMLAVSDGPVITPTSTWSFFYFQHDLVAPTSRTDTGAFADYPTLGIDANALYIGVNIFGTRGSGSFANTTGFVIRKSSVLGAGPIVVTAFRNLIPKNGGGPYTPQGVDNFDPNATEGYFIGVDSQYYGRLQLVRISNPGGTPSASTVQINLPVINGGTIAVPHLGNTGGTAGNLDGLDYRLLAAHLRNGRLWTSANIAVDNTGSASGTDSRMGVRWYEIQGIPTGQTPAVLQTGTVFQPSATNSTDQRNFWMGTVMVSGQGHAAMGFSVAGVNEYVNAGSCGRLVNDPVGTMRTPVLYTSTTNSYNPLDRSGNPIERWGDYSYTSLDPNDDMTMWTIQEFCDAPNSYGVQVVKLSAPAPATPINCSPNTVTSGMTNVNVVVTGLITNGSGFFDPGAGFSNRIAAAVNGGGVTVNNVTYTDPSHITLNISVSPGAAAGARTLTVTNPDGQATNSPTSLLTIINSGATNNPPSLTAISNATINEGSNFVFTATASDGDAGQSLTFSLDPGAPSGASITTNGNFSWTPSEAQGPSTNSITVRVTDNGVPTLSDAKTFSVTVSEVNGAPILTAITNRTVNEGVTLTVTNVASDSDIPANTITYSLGVGAPSGAAINSGTGVFTWTPTESQGPGVYPITVIATDNGSPTLSSSNSFSVTVNEVNVAPSLSAVTNRIVDEGVTLTITNVATDSDVPANTITYSLGAGAPSGVAIDSGTGVLTWTPTESQGPGVYSISVIATDNGSPTLSNSNSFSVTVNEVNVAPTLSTITNRIVNEGVTLAVTNVASDLDIPANTITYSLDTNAPAGSAIDPGTGVFTWTPAESQGPGVYSITVIATDNGSPVLTSSNSFSVTVNEANVAPVLGAMSTRTVHAGSLVLITNTASDADVPTNILTFSLTNAPVGMSIDSSTGVATWMPTDANANSTNTFTVQVTDNGSPNLSDSKTGTVIVMSRPTFVATTTSNSIVTLTWTAIPLQSYRVEYKNDLSDAVWTNLGVDVQASGSTASTTDSLGNGERFYRIVLP